MQDADLEYDPAEIPLVMQPILEGRADLAYGSRFLVRRAERRRFPPALAAAPLAEEERAA